MDGSTFTDDATCSSDDTTAGPSLLQVHDDISRAALLSGIELFVQRLLVALKDGTPLPGYSFRTTRAVDARGRHRMARAQSQSTTKHLTLVAGKGLARMVSVLSRVHELVRTRKTCTLREFYYMFKSVFRTPSGAAASINDVCVLLKCPRHRLGILGSPKGLFGGSVRVVPETRTAMSSSSSAAAAGAAATTTTTSEHITGELAWGASTRLRAPRARFILVIEKEGIFERLLEDRFFAALPCVLVTGKGFPDLATRAFVHRLVQELDLPVLGLADLNPHGAALLATYKFGSYGTAESYLYAVPSMRWLGMHVRDLGGEEEESKDEEDEAGADEQENGATVPSEQQQQQQQRRQRPPRERRIAAHHLAAWTKLDKSKAKELLASESMQTYAPRWAAELRRMQRKGVKCDLEALLDASNGGGAGGGAGDALGGASAADAIGGLAALSVWAKRKILGREWLA